MYSNDFRTYPFLFHKRSSILFFSSGFRDHQNHAEEQEGYDHPGDEDGRALFAEHIIVSFQVDDYDDPRQDIGHITTYFFRKFHTLSAVCLPDKIFPAPSVFMGTEEQVYDGTERQDIIRYQEIFEVHNICPCPERLESRPDAEPEYTWNA